MSKPFAWKSSSSANSGSHYCCCCWCCCCSNLSRRCGNPGKESGNGDCNCCFCWVTTWSQLLLSVPALLFCLRRKTLCFCTKPTISTPPPPSPPPSALCAQRMLRFARICCNFSLSANAFAGKFWLNAPREFTLLGPFRVTPAVYFALPPALPLCLPLFSLFLCLFLALPLSFEFDKWRSWRGDMLCNLGICFSPRGEI